MLTMDMGQVDRRRSDDFLQWLETKIELTWVDKLTFPQSYEHLTSTRARTHEGLLTIPNARYLERALDKYEMLR